MLKPILVSPDSFDRGRLTEAFAAIEPGLSTLQRDVLSMLYHAPERAIPVDGKGQYSNIVNALGKIGGKLSKELNCQPEKGYHLLWIACQEKNASSGIIEWRMRENFAAALVAAGW